MTMGGGIAQRKRSRFSPSGPGFKSHHSQIFSDDLSSLVPLESPLDCDQGNNIKKILDQNVVAGSAWVPEK